MRSTFAALALLLTVPVLAAQTLDPVEEAIVRYVDDHTTEAIGFLERVVNINSGTMNLPGVREVGRMFAPAYNFLHLQLFRTGPDGAMKIVQA